MLIKSFIELQNCKFCSKILLWWSIRKLQQKTKARQARVRTSGEILFFEISFFVVFLGNRKRSSLISVNFILACTSNNILLEIVKHCSLKPIHHDFVDATIRQGNSCFRWLSIFVGDTKNLLSRNRHFLALPSIGRSSQLESKGRFVARSPESSWIFYR